MGEDLRPDEQRAIDRRVSHAHARRTRDGIRQGGGAWNRRRLTDPFGAQRTDWRGDLDQAHIDVGDLIRGRQLVVEKRSAAKLTVTVVDELFAERATQRLHRAAMDLP